MTRIRVTIACVLLAATMHATQRDPWVRIRSAHFELFTSAGEPGGRDLVRFFEQVRSFFHQAFSLDGNARPVRIVCFRSDKEYQQYRPSEVADAFFQPGVDHDYIVMKGSAAELYPTAIHEYTHLLVRQSRMDLPHWLNEGLAELYASMEPEGSQIVVGNVLPGRLQTLEREPWIDLSDLVADDETLHGRKGRAAMFYAESWALVHMLALDNRYSPRLRSMIDALEKSSAAEAFQATYGKTVNQVQQDLHAYLTGSSLNAAVFHFQLPDSLEEPRVDREAAMHARLALAELLSNENSRENRAEASFRAILRDYENRWEVEAGWAEFLARERRNDAAAQHFERAAGLGADDSRMYLIYGKVLTMTGHPADALRILQTAARLDPGFDDAHFELAVALVRSGKYADALAEFHAIRHLSAEHAYRYFYYLAYAHYRVGDIGQARKLAGEARHRTHNPEEIAAVDKLEESLGQ